MIDQSRRVEGDVAALDPGAEFAVEVFQCSVAAEQGLEPVEFLGIPPGRDLEFALTMSSALAATRAWKAAWPCNCGMAWLRMKSATMSTSSTAVGWSCMSSPLLSRRKQAQQIDFGFR